jgi:alpha-galactosidase
MPMIDYLAQNLLNARPTCRIASFRYGTQACRMHAEEEAASSAEDSGKHTHLFHIQQDQILVSVRMTRYPAFEAVGWEMIMKNVTDRNTPQLTSLDVLDLAIPFNAEKPLRYEGINGDTCGARSFLPFGVDFHCGMKMSIQPVGGKSSHEAFPFFDLVAGGELLICGIGWSGTWYYELSRDETGLSIKAGLPDADFHLRPGEEVRLPSILLKTHKGSRQDGHNAFRRLMRAHFSPAADIKMPITLQTFDRYTYNTPFWNSEAGQKKVVECLNATGHMNAYWLDAAWFTGGFPNGVGNYRFREGFPDGLAPVTDYAHGKGLRAMIWFEPERVAEGTDVEREHPELLLHADPRGYGICCSGSLVNLADGDAVAWLSRKIGDMIEAQKIDI